MTIRQDAARIFSNRIIGKTLPYPAKHNPELQSFIERQEFPQNSKLSEHQKCWTKMFMAFARQYPAEQAEHDQMTEQYRY